MITLRDFARSVALPWLLIAAGTFVLAAIALGYPRYSLSIPAGSISAYAERGVYVAQAPAPVWPRWLFLLPQDDAQDGRASRLALIEDGFALGPAHTPAAEIARHRGGGYAHWDGAIYFSASDHSDPRRNGRRYEASSALKPSFAAWLSGWILVAVGAAWLLSDRRRREIASRIARTGALPALYVAASLAAALWVWTALIGVHFERPLRGVRHTFENAYQGALPTTPAYLRWLERRADHRAAPALRPAVLLLEDGAPVGLPRSSYDSVVRIGAGRYIYQSGHIFFSTVDGSSPLTNGRVYSARVRLVLPNWAQGLTLALLFAAAAASYLRLRKRKRALNAGLAGVLAVAAALAALSHTGMFRFEEWLANSRLTPSYGQAYEFTHRALVAPFVAPMPPGRGTFELVVDGNPATCGEETRGEVLAENGRSGFPCVRRRIGIQADFVPPITDPRAEQANYAVRYSVVVHPYLAALLAIAAALFAAAAVRPPSRRTVALTSSVVLATAGAALLGVSLLGLALDASARGPASDDWAFRQQERSLSFDEASTLLLWREDDTHAGYAARANDAIYRSFLHGEPAENLERWRLHVPIWENWALHLGALFDASLLRYHYWDHVREHKRGIGLCGHLSSVLVAYLEERQIPARMVSLTGHIVVTAEVAPGVWHIFDPDYGIVIPQSLAEIQADPMLMRQTYAQWATDNPTMLGSHPFVTTTAPRFYESAGDNFIDEGGRTGFYYSYLGSTDAYIAREAFLDRLKWIVPILMMLSGLCGLLLIHRHRVRTSD